MFGKPQWFREKNLGWGLVPITWQGWVYSTVWGSVIVGPTIALVAANKGAVETLIWVGVSTAALVWDVRKLRQELKGPVESDVLVIDEDTDISSLATRNFDMHLRE